MTGEQGNESSHSIKAGKFFNYLSDWLLLKKDSVQWSQLFLSLFLYIFSPLFSLHLIYPSISLSGLVFSFPLFHPDKFPYLLIALCLIRLFLSFHHFILFVHFPCLFYFLCPFIPVLHIPLLSLILSYISYVFQFN